MKMSDRQRLRDAFAKLTRDERALLTCALAGNHPAKYRDLRMPVLRALAHTDREQQLRPLRAAVVGDGGQRVRYLVEFRDHDEEPITHADIEDALSEMLTTRGHDGTVNVSMVAVLTPQDNPYPEPMLKISTIQVGARVEVIVHGGVPAVGYAEGTVIGAVDADFTTLALTGIQLAEDALKAQRAQENPRYPHPGPGENIMGTEHDD